MEIVHDLTTILPAIIVAFGGLVNMMVDAFSDDSKSIYWISVLAVLAAGIVSVIDLTMPSGEAFSGMYAYGGAASFGTLVILIATFFCVVLSKEYLSDIHTNYGEAYALMLFATVGMIVLASAANLVMIFIGIETMSICLYVLAGLVRNQKTSIEASLKYFLLGAFSTGFLLYGIALLYGATGTMHLTDIGAATNKGLIYWAGVGLLLVGFFFKVSAVPFHMWTPDVYQGSPTTVTAFMATASKSATFVALIMVLTRALPGSVAGWSQVIVVIAILTMIVGNIIAIVQDNVKRMLAYSSIAHAGYLLVGLVAGSVDGYSSVLFYLFAYSLMNVGAFGVVAYYEKHHGLDFTSVENYAGLGFKQPLMGVLLSIFLFSLAGIPPFIGFIAKYKVFAAAINAGYIGLAIVGVLASAASVYYYLRVMVYLYMREGKEEVTLTSPGTIFKVALIILAIGTLYFGIVPSQLYHVLAHYTYGHGLAAIMP
jgi:NADH-quinone oxidoreductase subunit N